MCIRNRSHHKQFSRVKLIYMYIALHIHHEGITSRQITIILHSLIIKTHFISWFYEFFLKILHNLEMMMARQEWGEAKFNFHKQQNHISFQTSVSERWECQNKREEGKKIALPLSSSSLSLLQWIFFLSLTESCLYSLKWRKKEEQSRSEEVVLLHLIILLFLLQVI